MSKNNKFSVGGGLVIRTYDFLLEYAEGLATRPPCASPLECNAELLMYVIWHLALVVRTSRRSFSCLTQCLWSGTKSSSFNGIRPAYGHGLSLCMQTWGHPHFGVPCDTVLVFTEKWSRARDWEGNTNMVQLHYHVLLLKGKLRCPPSFLRKDLKSFRQFILHRTRGIEKVYARAFAKWHHSIHLGSRSRTIARFLHCNGSSFALLSGGAFNLLRPCDSR